MNLIMNNHPRKKLTNYTKLFKDTLEKSGFELDRIIQGELNKDLELGYGMKKKQIKSTKNYFRRLKIKIKYLNY